MFNKKNKNKNQEEDKIAQQEEELNRKVEESIKIHTIPREAQKDISSKISPSKKAGIIIVSGGVILLILMAIGFYYIIFSSNQNNKVKQNPKTQESSEPSSQQVAPIEKTEKVIKEKEENNVLLPVEEEKTTFTIEVATTTKNDTTSNIDIEEKKKAKGIFDTDQDGLFDKEELILGSNLGEIDTDGDGYGDLSEVLNLYNPVGAGILKENEHIKEFKSDFYGYSILYPADWDFNMISSVGDSLIIKSDDNHFFRLIVEPNPKLQSIENWYKEQFEVDDIKEENKENSSLWQGIRSDDGLILYLTDLNRDYIFILSYTPVGDTLDYKNLFEMMIKSFSI